MPLPPPVIIGNATLYTFAGRGLGPIQVVRVPILMLDADADADFDDWLEWAKHYSLSHPNIGELLEVANVDVEALVILPALDPDGV